MLAREKKGEKQARKRHKAYMSWSQTPCPQGEQTTLFEVAEQACVRYVPVEHKVQKKHFPNFEL